MSSNHIAESEPDSEPVSVQVFLDASVAPDLIGEHLKARLAECGYIPLTMANRNKSSGSKKKVITLSKAAANAKLGKVSRLARSINLKATSDVVDFVHSLPEVVEILPENLTDWYPKPVKSRPVPSPNKPQK